MNKQLLHERVVSMITSATKKPKYSALSAVKLADMFGTTAQEIETTLGELVSEGKLKKTRLDAPPHATIYLLP